jgi:hypothetical protein
MTVSVTFTAGTADGTTGLDMDDMLNVNDGNAAVLLDALGLDGELDGALPAAEFLGRVLVGLGLAPVDEGRPAVTDSRWTDCGRRPGYVQDRLAELRTIAQRAADEGWEVSWS